MKYEELKEQSISDLKIKVNELLKELFMLRLQKGIDELHDTHRFKCVRRDIARIKTVINEKKVINS